MARGAGCPRRAERTLLIPATAGVEATNVGEQPMGRRIDVRSSRGNVVGQLVDFFAGQPGLVVRLAVRIG